MDQNPIWEFFAHENISLESCAFTNQKWNIQKQFRRNKPAQLSHCHDEIFRSTPDCRFEQHSAAWAARSSYLGGSRIIYTHPTAREGVCAILYYSIIDLYKIAVKTTHTSMCWWADNLTICVHSDTFQVPIHCTDTELGGLAGVCCALGDVWMKWIHWFSAKYTWDIHDQYAKCLRKILCNRSMHIGTHNINRFFPEQRSRRPNVWGKVEGVAAFAS